MAFITLSPKLRLVYADCRDVLRELPDDFIDSCVTDPPYGIGFMGKQWDQPGAFVERRAQRKNKWDHVGGNHNPCNAADAARTRRIEGIKYGDFLHEIAVELFRVLKPGAHLVAFGASRGYHRMACAIEDAGFEIRDSLMWVYSSGFPKSHNIGDGLGTALKPAFEPIVLARKPLSEGTVAANVLKWGTGALNIDGTRIPSGSDHAEKCASVVGLDSNLNGDCYGEWKGVRTDSHSPLGRWPANVCHDGSDEVVGMFPSAPAQSAARFFYSAKANKADRAGSKHPTVKPIALMQWLARLITPPGGIILDPFAGSGTTGAAAAHEGFTALLCEREEEYVRDIMRRFGVGVSA